jgi:hypothetical protein
MEPTLDRETAAVFRKALRTLIDADVPFVVAGAFAVNHYTGIWRNTKDLDLFVQPRHAGVAIEALAGAGFDTRVQERHWLGKALLNQQMVDVIWAGGNWATVVDEHWFAHAEPGRMLGVDVMMAPAEDMILSKAYVAGRERFDGADIMHLIRARGDRFDWDDLVARFGDHWELLLHYLILYRFVYPRERDNVPLEVVRDLSARIGTDEEDADGLPFRGLLLDRYAYLHDLRYEGLADPGIAIAERTGHDPAAVRRRRTADARAFDAGKVYRPSVADAEADREDLDEAEDSSEALEVYGS